MFAIKTATGKELKSSYAVSIPNPPLAYIRVKEIDLETARQIFYDKKELPLDMFPQFNTVDDVIDEGRAIKIILKP